ncbi:hypothetical protein Micbo1qcDRAFT_155046 [Microdochium bolleyi]|uniref:Uncharacterized protein n=1 Tax=Microdochium bolleyi TaxID=196109 RepID=A0A136JH43_9PEZI|nr:hypothetical protein Micbo1qcDRAFT_155046 [Microdochium bolleyi]
MASSHEHSCHSHTASPGTSIPRSESPASYDSGKQKGNVKQDIPGRCISPDRLKRQLKLKFGENNYSVYMMHNAYHVTACRRLSEDEIDWCRL